MFLFVSSLIRLRMATADCFVEYVVFIYIIPTFYFTKIVLVFLNFFSQAKVPEKYGSHEIQSEETKSEEKRHPACERHNRANDMCAPYVEARPKGGARAEKEIGEKAQKIIRHQIVSTYFLHGAFKVLFSA